jgi:S-formylglutathione hydrolase
MQAIESIKECNGDLNRYQHYSDKCHCQMTFSVYLPPQAKQHKVPALYWLSGLTCTDNNARTKAGMQRYATEQGIALIFPDTSPRGDKVADNNERYDLGQGAGFYLNASEQPWQNNYQMYDYITQELPLLIESYLPILANIRSISGHSMGGHGALICALKKPNHYCSVSAFAPICHPSQSPWGQNAFATYLGQSQSTWLNYDATELMLSLPKTSKKQSSLFSTILIDQGTDDEFYQAGQLLPEDFQAACNQQDQPLTLRFQAGYDHSYHFIASFIGEHIAYHAQALKLAI